MKRIKTWDSHHLSSKMKNKTEIVCSKTTSQACNQRPFLVEHCRTDWLTSGCVNANKYRLLDACYIRVPQINEKFLFELSSKFTNSDNKSTLRTASAFVLAGKKNQLDWKHGIISAYKKGFIPLDLPENPLIFYLFWHYCIKRSHFIA